MIGYCDGTVVCLQSVSSVCSSDETKCRLLCAQGRWTWSVMKVVPVYRRVHRRGLPIHFFRHFCGRCSILCLFLDQELISYRYSSCCFCCSCLSDRFKKSQGAVDRIGMKLCRIVLHVNKHRLTESDSRIDATLSRRRP